MSLDVGSLNYLKNLFYGSILMLETKEYQRGKNIVKKLGRNKTI